MAEINLFFIKLKNYIVEVFYEYDSNWTNNINIYKILKNNGFTNFKKIGSNVQHHDILAKKC